MPHPPAPPPGKRQPVVLLAEDNTDNRTLLVDYLGAQGFRLVVATDGAEAVRLTAEVCPDLLVLDIHMPGMDGLEAIRRIRADARFAATPIIALTALAMVGDRERCLDAGASEYVSKPVRLRRLAEVMRSYL